MKTLFLVRHGKSSYSLTLDDKERPLTERGINDINHIAVRVETILPKNLILFGSQTRFSI
jgi:phosphohistidine phosphatase